MTKNKLYAPPKTTMNKSGKSFHKQDYRQLVALYEYVYAIAFLLINK